MLGSHKLGAVFEVRHLATKLRDGCACKLRWPEILLKLQLVPRLYSVSQKSSLPKTFCDIFTCGKPVKLKITVAIAQTYSYVCTNFDPFI